MVISGITYFPYQLTLKTPFVHSKNIISIRNGFIIEITDCNGNVGIGEVAPLPEFGSETFEMSRTAILRFASEYPEEVNDISDIFSSLRQYNETPAAWHGIEQALLNLYSAVRGASLPQLLNFKYNPVIKVNSLIGLVRPDQAAVLAANMVNEGYKTIKLKAGRQSFQQDIDTISTVREVVGTGINLRIDINGKWDYREAINNIRILEKYSPEYIEQPVSIKEDLVKVASVVDVSIAADESLRTIYDVNECIEKKFFDVLILKPMLIGGIIEIVEVIRKANENNIKTIISSSFESVVGFRTNVLLASFVKDKYAHGLSTINFFNSDLYENPFTIQDGQINIIDPYIFSIV